MQTNNYSVPDNALAIVGMAGRFPGAKNVKEFWHNLVNGVESIRFFSDEELLAAGVKPEIFKASNYVRAGTVLEDIDLFDAPFFGFTPREAETMDPQARLFMQCAWEAFENAGYYPATYKGLIGVFAGKGFPYYMTALMSNAELVELVGLLQIAVGNERDSLASLISYKFDLKGPSISVQTFCSTSMVAVHLACQSLLAYECDMALAGGVAVNISQGTGYLYQEGGILSPDGVCRTFDKQAKGSVISNGLGTVVLKRLESALEEGDQIYAVILGSATNNDGLSRVGYTAPGLNGQAAVISEALGNAGVKAETIGYIEAHGTATPLGDSIELAAMRKAFDLQTDKKQFCAIGSIKPNVGHLDRASGVTGLIKTALALKEQCLPPSLNFERANPEVGLDESPFYVNTKLTDWKPNGPWPLRAGVSSFGLGGTNVHLVLEQAPTLSKSSSSSPLQLLLISAKTTGALEIATSNLVSYLQGHPDLNLADVAYTLQVGRGKFNHRRMVVCCTPTDGADAMSDPQRVLTAMQTKHNQAVAFMFPGLGDHYVGMGYELYQTEPVFRQAVDDCCEYLLPLLDIDLRDILYKKDEMLSQAVSEPRRDMRHMLGRQPTREHPLQQTALAQPSMFVVEYALAQLLMTWGLQPSAMIGYSLGEYVAACLSGVFSLEDALMLVAKRASMIQQLEAGAMLAVTLSEEDVLQFLTETVTLAAIIGPKVSVLAGPKEAIAALAKKLTTLEIISRQLETTHAFHSPMMKPIADSFAALVQRVSLNAPKIPYLSNVTGEWVSEKEATDPGYWVRHLCQPVLFSNGLAALLNNKNLLLLEVGPGQALSSFVKQHPACDQNRLNLVFPTMHHAYEKHSDVAFLLNTLGRLWLAGGEIDWNGFYQDERRYRVSLPTYPFECLHYWIEPSVTKSLSTDGQKQSLLSQGSATPVLNQADKVYKEPDMADWFYEPIWQKVPLATLAGQAIKKVEALFSWLIFSDPDNELGEQVAKLITQQGGVVTHVTPGHRFSYHDQSQNALFTIRPNEPSDYIALCRELNESNRWPKKVVHLWNVTAEDEIATGPDGFAAAQLLGFYSLVFLAQALGKYPLNEGLNILVVSNNIHEITGSETLSPEKATLLAACKSIPQEYITTTCRTIDIDRMPITPTVVKQMFAEFITPSSDLVVAYRSGERYVQGFQPIHLEDKPTVPWRQQGTYLITGGLGGIGLVLAKHLAQKVQARLVLIGRSALIDKDQWQGWLDTHDDSDATSIKIHQVQELEALGAEVLVLPADIADYAKMKQVIETAHARFGSLHGVIHAAGISERKAFNIIQEITLDQCEMHFRPKVHGLYVLEKALAGLELDFCILYSSLSSVLAGLGLVGYAASNIFMDVLTYKHNRTNDTPWISINWDTWQVRKAQHDELGGGDTIAGYEMSPVEGIKALERILMNEHRPQVVNSTGNIETRIRQWIKLESLQTETKTSTPEGERPDLSTAYVKPVTNYEQKLATLWQELLGITQVGIDDNFFDLGGNSLIGLQLIATIKKSLQIQLPITALFEAPTISALAKYLRADEETDKNLQETKLVERRWQARQQVGEQEIAIIGMAGQFPGANNIEVLWQNLRDGVESITFFTDQELEAAGIPSSVYKQPGYVKARPVIEDAELFDALFFGYSPREAELTDPQHRLFLQSAWEALENAGYSPKDYPGLIGVYGGSNISSYILDLITDPNFLKSLKDYEARYQLVIGGDRDSLATGTSYKLNLKGPSFTVQTFCSTSLVATHLGCQSLLNGECDIALAGGVSIRTPLKSGYMYREGGRESSDGHCRTFDAKADGTLFGDGVAIVVLKRLKEALQDGDHIYAVIKGSAINNDGAMKVGYSAPSVDGQAEVIATALENANVTADTISYIEAYGIATNLGDPIEITALTRAFRRTTDATGYCAIGSLKTNIGYLQHASGVCGLIKTALALKHRLIPPSLHFEEPNPEIDFENSPFYVNTKLSVWEKNGGPRRAGVNSLGMGGTNVHMVLEEAPSRGKSGQSRPKQLLLLSAQTESALELATSNLLTHLRKNPTLNLADVAYTLQVGRNHFKHRRMVVCCDLEDAVTALQDPSRIFTLQQSYSERPVAFIFPSIDGNYSHYVYGLYETEPLFREWVDRCSKLLKPYPKIDLHAILFQATETSQVAVFVVEYAHAQSLIAWGINPRAVLGLGVGELVAACLSEIFSLEDALMLVVKMTTENTPFSQLVQNLTLNSPKIPYVSNATGDWMTEEEADSAHFALNLNNSVPLSQANTELLYKENFFLLEVGARQDNSDEDGSAFLLNIIGQLWLAGGQIDWSRFYKHEYRHRLSLPTYPFERQRYWIEVSSLMEERFLQNDVQQTEKKAEPQTE